MSRSKKIGLTLMILGFLLVGAAVALFLYNQREDAQAGTASAEVIPLMIQQIEEQDTVTETPSAEEALSVQEMTEVEIDGYLYIGYVSIPSLDLELPVMSQWDYPSLKIAPCRYAGSTWTDNLVICAHNYARHFGNIKNLSMGDEVVFTDMDGNVNYYSVVSVETLDPYAVEEMTDAGYDLTLFTCTYGGATRVTVRCNRITK